MFHIKIKTKRLISLSLISSMLMPICTPVSQAFFDNEKAPVSQIEKTKVISLLVDEKLLENDDLKTRITRYGMDISKKLAAKVVQIPIPDDASPKDIWEGNAHLYFSGLDSDQKSQLIGTILIGNVPISVVDKGGTLLPTIFPYTDFENPAYVWDEIENRFIQGRGDFQSEIWHGVIRSSVTDSLDSRQKELIDYFDRNHSFQTGSKSFSKKVFFADLPLQKNGLPDELLDKYNSFIEHLEDLVYLRFNKHLLKKLLDNQNFDDVIPWDDLADEVKPTESFTISDNIKHVPDIQTKLIIDNFVQRYVEVYKNHLSRWNKNIKNSGRWSPNEVDTTISLVTRKDELSALILRGANDAFEKILTEKVQAANVDENMEIPLTEELLLVEGGESGMTTPIIKPLYWNGVLRTELTANDCSLNRGILKDEDHPFAVLAEANRTFDLNTFDSCAHKDEPTADKNADKYEGCCAKNITADSSLQITSNGTCNTESEWLPKTAFSESSFIHYGAELPVFDIAGGIEVFTGQSGAIGCKPIFDYSPVLGFSSFMVHNEPTPQSIKNQIGNYGTRSLPVDDPRGFSFYDHKNVFHRIQFLNLFDYRQEFAESDSAQLKNEIETALTRKIQEINTITTAGNAVSNAALELARNTTWPSSAGAGECTHTKVETQVDEFTVKIKWTESCENPGEVDPDAEPDAPEPDPIITISKIVRYYEVGDLISANIFDEILKEIDLDEIVEAIYWIDKDIDEKNQIVFEKAFSKPEIFQEFFHDDEFEGYEFTEVLTSPLSDGIEMDFEWGGVGFYDEEYEESLHEAKGFVFTPHYEGGEKKILGVLESELTVGKNLVFEDAKGKMKIIPATKISNSAVEKIKIEPTEIFIAASDVDPIKINVSLRDEFDQIVETDFESEVELVFSTTAKDLFKIAPFQKSTVQHGETSFYLVPKTANESQKVAFYAKSNELKSDKVFIEIFDFDLNLTADKFEVSAKDDVGVFLKARVFDLDDNLSFAFDGETVQFTTDWGTFEGGQNIVKIENGVAALRFFPGKKAGKAEILVNDLNKKLPSQKILIEIQPGEPMALDLGSDRALVKGADFTNVSAQIIDEYGNIINDLETNFEWKTENLEIENSTKTVLKNSSKEGQTFIAIRPQENETEARIEVSADVLPKDTGRAVNFNIVENPILKAEISKEKIVAGDSGSVKIKVSAETENQKKIRGDFEVKIIEKTGLFEEDVNTFFVQDGVGEFNFTPSTKAGNFEIELISKGFISTKVNFSVLPEESKKIKISKRKKLIEMDEDKSFFIDVQVLDKFGNIADFDGQIWVYPTTKTADTIKRQVTHVYLHNGVGELEIWPVKSGLVHLIAKLDTPEKSDSTVNSLILDVMEFEIDEKFSLLEASNLYSKSIFSMWLDFAGFDFLRPKSFANRILHNGETLALGTHINDPDPSFRFGFVAPDGKINKKLTPKFQFGEVLDFKISSVDKELVQVQVLFDNPSVFVNEENKTKEGLYLDFEDKFNSDIKEEEGRIFLEEKPLFTIQKLGGVVLENAAVRFVQKDRESLFNWTIFLDNQKLGSFKIVLTQTNLSLVNDFPQDGLGVFVKLLAENVNVQEVFIGNSTNELRGLAFVSNEKKESFLKKLGQDKNSQRKIWEGDFKPGILFAAKNSAGESTKFGADDNFILLGDPTVSVLTDNTKSAFGFTTDVGKVLWKTPNRQGIDQILTGDANGDGNTDIFVRADDSVFGLLADNTQTQNFRDFGQILRLADGGKTLLSLESDDEFTNLLQLNNEGKFILHSNENGNFERKELNFSVIERPIIDVKKGNFNGDGSSDLAILDDWNGLWVALGTGNDFKSPQKLTDFFPNFEENEEVFSVAVSKQGDFNRLQQKKSAPVLDKFLITFTELEADNILEFVDKKPFVSLSDNAFVNAKIKTSNEGKTTLKPNDQILVEFEIDADTSLSNFEFIIPDFGNLKVVEDSFLCNGCSEKPVLKEIRQKLVAQNIAVPQDKKIKFQWEMRVDKMIPIDFSVGDFDHRDKIDDISIPREIAGEKKLVQFLSNPLPKTTSFFPKSWLVSLQTLFMTEEDETQVLELQKRIVPVLNLKVSPAPSGDISTIFKNKISEQNSVTGLPAGFNGAISQKIDYTSSSSTASNQLDNALNEVRNNQNDFVCGDGTCGVSIFSKAFMGPGLDVTYLSPLAFFSGFNLGFPILAIPTTLITPHGPIPSVWPPIPLGKQFPNVFTSLFRTYLSPTTTGKVGLSMCFGLYVPNMVAPIYSPMCFVGVPSTLPDFNITEEVGLEEFVDDVNRKTFSAENFQTGESGSVFQINASTSLGSGKGKNNDFKLSDSIPDVGNIQIGTVDIISKWVSAQYKEIENFHFPSIILKRPDLPELDIPSTQIGAGASSQKVAFETIFGVEKRLLASLTSNKSTKENSKQAKASFDKELEELNKSPFFSFEKRKITIPIPKFQEGGFDKIEKKLGKLKTEIGDFADKMEEEIANFDLNLDFDPNVLKEIITESIEEIKVSFAQVDEILKSLKDLQAKIKGTDFEKTKKDLSNLQTRLKNIKDEAQKAIDNAPNEMVAANAKEVLDWANKIDVKLDQNLEMIEAYKSFSEIDFDTQILQIKNKINELISNLENFDFSFDKDVLAVEIKSLITEILDKFLKFPEEIAKQIEELKKLPEKILELQKLPEKLMKMIEDLKKIETIFKDYLKLIEEGLLADLKEWLVLRETLIQLMNAWEIIPQIFVGFTMGCPTPGCSADRGTLIQLLLKILLGSISLPVMTMPQLPDIILDLSNISFGLKVPIPEIELKPLELDLSSLVPSLSLPNPSLSDLDFDLSAMLKEMMPSLADLGIKIPKLDIPDFGNIGDLALPTDFDFTRKINLPDIDIPTLPPMPKLDLDFDMGFDASKKLDINSMVLAKIKEKLPFPKIPKLPKLPILDLDFKIPMPTLPPIPHLPAPPEIPDVLGPLLKIVEIPKKIMKLICLLVMGVAPVPEWTVNAYVAQLTNRTDLVNFDFSLGALMPSLPRKKLEPIVIAPEFKMEKEITALIDTLQGVVDSFTDMITKFGAQNKLSEPIKNFKIPLKDFGKEISQVPNIITTVYNFTEDDFADVQPDARIMAQIEKIKEFPAKLEDEYLMQKFAVNLKSILPSPPKYLTDIQNPKMTQWNASIDDFMISDKETSSVPETYPEPASGIYFINPETEESGFLIDYKPERDTAISLANFEIKTAGGKNYTIAEKGSILFSIDDLLFLKNKVEPDLSDEQAKIGNIIDWSFEEFKEKFAPFQTMKTRTSIAGAKISGEKFSDIPYVEWRITDRLDHLLEDNLDTKERQAEKWDRYAKLFRKDDDEAQIRSVAVKVTKIFGKPIFYSIPQEEVPSCDDKIQLYWGKNVFHTETQATRFKVEKKQENELNEEIITIKAGEEFVIENAKVCVLSGVGTRFEDDNSQQFEAKRNFVFSPEFRIETGKNDSVELELFDGSILNISGGENFSMEIGDEGDDFSQLVPLPINNFYGSVLAMKKNKKSFLIPTMLHDPQLSDDIKAPIIQIAGGTEVLVPVFQKIIIDATNSFDEREITDVFWDLNGEFDSDKDGNAENDFDFPLKEMKFSARELLKISLPPREREGLSSIILNVTDQSGNTASQKIEIKAMVPKIKLFSASVRDGEIEGELKNKFANVPIYFNRKRNARSEFIWDKPVFTDKKGRFSVENIISSGGIEISEMGKAVVEILPTGRPVVFDNRFNFQILPATSNSPFKIRIHNEKNVTVGYVFFETKEGTVEIQKFIDGFSESNLRNLSGANVWDGDLEDGFVFKKFSDNSVKNKNSVALIDKAKAETIGVLDGFGNFYITEDSEISFRIKKAINETDAVVFEILVNKVLIGEFVNKLIPQIFIR